MMKKIEIDKNNNIVKISFNTKIYNKKNIDEAVALFKENFNVSHDKGNVTIRLLDDSYTEIIGYEFYNSVLELMKN